MRSADDARDYEPTVRLLADRGHDVHVVANLPAIPFNALCFLGLDFARRLELLHENDRNGWLGHVLRGCERTLPRPAQADDFIRAHDPDVVLTSNVESGSSHADYVRSARALGIPVWRTAVTDVDVAALEAQATCISPLPARAPWWGPLARPLLARAAERLARTDAARTEKASRQERLKEQRDAALVARRAEAAVARRLAEAEHARREQEEAASVERERLAREASAARAYERYQSVREWALRMQQLSTAEASDAAEAVSCPSLTHLWNARPETIADLRRHCEALGAARVADYQDPDAELATRLRQAIVSLRRWVGSDLFVPESPVLGGFGYIVRRDLCNEDTLRFFRVLVALQDAAILGDCRRADARRLVWEIGGGWGGFAYQFKTVCRNVTYLITGRPEQLLVSATYLQAAFPEARCRFFEEADDDLWRDWEQIDFLFAPESALALLQPPRVDVTFDILALRGMTPPRVCAHVQRAFDLGSRYFYSLLPGASAADDAAMVAKGIERLYWIHPVPARSDADSGNAGTVSLATDIDHAHVVGWRRLRV